jgi:D-alanyl-D-alanine carboxypeptidase
VRWPTLLSVLLVLGVGAVDSLGATGPADSALDRGLEALVATRGGPPGAISIVQRGDEITVHAAGVARIGAAAPPRATLPMRIASMSKAYNGATALALVDRGVLSLADTIGERLPDLPRTWHAVTLRQLLNHTSGMPDYLETPRAQQAVAASPGRAPSPSRLLDFVADQPLRFAPGSRYKYSNSDNIAVGLMIRAATGRSYERELRRVVLAPLRVNRTALPRGTRLPRRYIHGYEVDPPSPPEDVSRLLAGGWSWASGGIVTTPAELNRFIRGYVGGRLFGARVRAQQLRFVAGGSSEPPGPGANAAGLGLFRYRTSCGTVYGHTGNIFGYTQFAAATLDGTRSATVSVTAQRTPENAPAVFAKVRRAGELAVCAALAR